MTDDEVLARMPAAREFVDAVKTRDADMVRAAFEFTDPLVLAVLVAEMLVAREKQLTKAKTVLHATRGIKPAGMSKLRAWQIAVASEDRRAA